MFNQRKYISDGLNDMSGLNFLCHLLYALRSFTYLIFWLLYSFCYPKSEQSRNLISYTLINTYDISIFTFLISEEKEVQRIQITYQNHAATYCRIQTIVVYFAH